MTALVMFPWTHGVNVFSSYALMLGSLQDLANRTVKRTPLFLLYALGVMHGIDLKQFSLWLLFMGWGAWLGHLKKVPLGEGDVYVLAGLALFHAPFDLLVIVTLAVWLLLPLTLNAIRLKHKGQPYQLPFIPALFIARQMMLLGSILV